MRWTQVDEAPTFLRDEAIHTRRAVLVVAPHVARELGVTIELVPVGRLTHRASAGDDYLEINSNGYGPQHSRSSTAACTPGACNCPVPCRYGSGDEVYAAPGTPEQDQTANDPELYQLGASQAPGDAVRPWRKRRSGPCIMMRSRDVTAIFLITLVAAACVGQNRRGSFQPEAQNSMTTPTHHESVSVAEAKAFVDNWSRVWRERDGRAYAALLDKDCVLYNPFGSLTRDQLPGFVDSLIASLPDHRIVATRWGAISDGVLIEWVMTGTLPGGPIELRGADRYTLRGGKAIEGVAYFDPRPFLERKEAPAKP